MRPVRKRAWLVLCTLVLLLGVIGGSLRRALAENVSPWFSTDSPALTKIVELSSKASVSDADNNVDCMSFTYRPTPLTEPVQKCAYNSPLGQMTTEGQLMVGDKLIDVEGPYRSSAYLPTTNSSTAIVMLSAPQIGQNIGIYHHLNKSDLKLVVDQYGSHYETTIQPDALVHDPVTRASIQLNPEAMAYSANGEWMVADIPQVGLLRVNMEDLSTELFAQSVEPSWYLGIANMSLAISDDGRYVAGDSDIFGSGSIQMYDLTTCSDQLTVPGSSTRHYCNYVNLWDGTPYSRQGGVSSDGSPLVYPNHIRFVDDTNVTFDALYDYKSPSNYKAASFKVSAAGSANHSLGLLGLGDSYISGQGTFVYRGGTDTTNNTCHLSELSYPFLLGHEHFNSYNSVACSGAKTNNIILGNVGKYTGQVLDRIVEDKRDKSPILANFEPGYIYQQEFASAYKPEAMLLSVGGDDIGFANIVKACVANQGGGTCYDTYEDRLELINEIDATYPKLVHTYQTLRQQSGGGRLYVVGYPQIAKPGGDCGLNVHLNVDELTFSAGLIDYLDGIIQQAASSAGVFYVDTQHAFDGHRLCETGDKAVNGLTQGNDVTAEIRGIKINLIGNESYHPTRLGYKLLAQTIDAQTGGLTAVMPVATKLTKPVFDAATPLLQNVASTGRQVRRVANDDTIINNIALQGDMQQVTVNGTEMQLQPGSKYQIVLHSDPILLDEGGVDEDGNISVSVRLPIDMPAGYHTLHVYGKDMAGDDVDIQKVFYIADNEGSRNTCTVVMDSGIDQDSDGIDDACDPEITSAVPMQNVMVKPASTSGSVSARQQTSDLARSEESTSTSSVLGAMTSQNAINSEKLASGSIKAAKLYKVNWADVIVGGFVLICLLTAIRY